MRIFGVNPALAGKIIIGTIDTMSACVILFLELNYFINKNTFFSLKLPNITYSNSFKLCENIKLYIKFYHVLLNSKPALNESINFQTCIIFTLE